MPTVNGRALSVPEMSRAPSRGFLKTLHEYAAPIDRCIDNAAGGTSQRLQPGGATIRSRLKNGAATLHSFVRVSDRGHIMASTHTGGSQTFVRRPATFVARYRG